MPEDRDQAEDLEELRARSFWSGTLTFGLVSVPVALFPATRSSRVSLRMLGPDGNPLRREYFDPKSDKAVERDEIVRGYELEEDQYVVVSDEELEALEPEKTRDIDLRQFVERDAIDPMYFDRAYFLTPAGESTKAYRLLAETMERTGRAGIATFVMRGKEYLIAILAEDGILRAETLRFADEVRTPEQIGLPEPPKVKPAAVKKFERAIAKAAKKTFDPDELEDRAAARLRELVESKRRAGEVVLADATPEEETSDDVIDLMEILKRSMAGAGAGARKAPRRSTGSGSASPKQAASADELERLPKSDLYKRAKAADIPGRSGMTREQLIRALRQSA